MTKTNQTILDQKIAELLTAGAALEVTNPDQTTRAWPLARHYKLTDDALWIRPVFGGHRSRSGLVSFPLGDCLRKPIDLENSTITETGTVQFELGSGQIIDIRPVNAEEFKMLDLWDTFVLTVLTAKEELQLDALDADSWHGRFL